MPQQSALVAQSSFINGLVTEATALNFPENAVVDTFDCVFDLDGSVYRRTGFDFETNYTTKTIDRDNNVVKDYLWQNVSGDGNTTVVVVQVGSTLYFYETDGTGIFSTGEQSTTVTLTPVSGAPATNAVEAQFTDGNGYLIVTHPYCDPMRISYDVNGHTATATDITLEIRDFEGDLDDPYDVDERPTSTAAALDAHHKYNLYNQSWNSTHLAAWDTAQTTMPSNADVAWHFKDSSDNIDFSTASLARVTAGNSPAAKGKFILELALQDRNSIVTGATNTTTSFQRPSACAFFAGRVFYAGINSTGFNSNIYFTQIIERVSQYGACYQTNDPTSEESFDLLPSDGGVIAIPEAGTVYKMHTVPGGLCVFAANGVWFITGSTGLGFTASDYAVLKIADISTISDTSFVNVNGFPCWWNNEGIYKIEAGQSLPTVVSLTYDTFKSFFDTIPVPSKRYARGFFDKTDGVIRWLYRETATTNINQLYEYTNVLNYNVRTKAFFPWTISDGDVKVHSIISTELVNRPIDVNNVVDNSSDNVIDSGGNQVITFSASGSEDQQFDKYLVSYEDGGSYEFTYANRINGQFRDWLLYDEEGIDYGGYFITGFKLPGGGIRKAQVNYIELFSRLDDAVSYKFQGIWDFALTGSGTGRWSTNQVVEHTDTNYGNARRRLKVRGHGKALQFKVTAVEDMPFDFIGWAAVQTINGAP